MVLVVRDGNIGAKLKFDVSTMNDFVKNIEVPPKLGLVHQKSFERIVGQAYSFNPDLSGDPVWFMKLSRMLEPDEGYVIEGSAVFICQIQHHGPCDKVSTEIAEFTEVISSEKEDDIFGSILKRADSSVSQPIEEVFSRDAAWIQSTMNEVCSYLESIVAKDFLSVVRNSFGCDLDRVADSLPPLINSTKVSQQLIIDLLLNLLVGCCEAEYVRKLEDSDIPEKDVAHPPSETFGIALLKMNHFHDLKLGKTKVFLRAGQIEVLDSQRAEVLVRLDTAAKCIRGRLRTYVARRDFLSTRVAAVSLQACCRGYLARKRYSEKREASSAISIQKYVRRWLLVDAYTKLRFSTLLIQSSIRGFLARQSFTQRNEHKAAMLIQSHWRMCKVRSAFRHRQVNIIAIQCLWRQKLAKRELWRLKKMGRSAGFNLGGTYSLHRPQQHAPSVSSSGVPFSSVNNHDLLHLHGSDMFQSSHSSYHSQTSGPPGIGLRPLNSPNTVSGMGSYDQLIQQYQQHQNQSQFQLQQMPGLNQSHRDQGVKSMQSAQAAPDSFGLLGLFRMSDPDLTSLALGIDLTTLGLNLNSTENLHKTFGSPWSDDPAKGDPEFVVPQCYYAKQPPALSQSHFLKFPMDTLFYIFYSMPKDEAQLYAANELYNRGWFYHRELRQWLTRVPNMEPLVKTNTYERGSYICFDPNTWEKIHKDNFIVHYEMLEKRPNLPQH